VGDWRNGLNFTGLTFFGFTAGMGGNGGDFTGLPIFPLLGLISGGACVRIGGLGLAFGGGCGGSIAGLDTFSQSMISPVPGTVRMISQRLRSLCVRVVLVLVKWEVHFFCFSISSRELNFRSGFSGLSPPELANRALTEPLAGGGIGDTSSDFMRDILCCGYFTTDVGTTCAAGSTINLLLLKRCSGGMPFWATAAALLLLWTSETPEGNGVLRLGGDSERSEEREDERSEPSHRLSSREPLLSSRELTFELDSTPSFSNRARALLNLAEWDSVRAAGAPWPAWAWWAAAAAAAAA